MKNSKIFAWIKENLRVVEHWTLLVSGILVCGCSLLFSILGDTMLNTTVVYLLFDMITGIVGGAMVLVATNINLFDVKKNGLILGTIGTVLAAGNIAFYPIYRALVIPDLIDTTRVKANIITVIMLIFTIIGVIGLIAGTVSCYLRKFSKTFKEEDEEYIITMALKKEPEAK